MYLLLCIYFTNNSTDRLVLSGIVSLFVINALLAEKVTDSIKLSMIYIETHCLDQYIYIYDGDSSFHSPLIASLSGVDDSLVTDYYAYSGQVIDNHDNRFIN